MSGPDVWHGFAPTLAARGAARPAGESLIPLLTVISLLGPDRVPPSVGQLALPWVFTPDPPWWSANVVSLSPHPTMTIAGRGVLTLSWRA